MSNKPKKSIGTVLIVMGVVLIMAALGLVLYNNWESDRAGDASEMALPALESIMFNNQMGLPGDDADALPPVE